MFGRVAIRGVSLYAASCKSTMSDKIYILNIYNIEKKALLSPFTISCVGLYFLATF